MPRPRTRENAGLPRRWRRRYNAYYYQVPIDERSRWDGKAEFRLGTSLSEAMRVYAERIEVNVHTVRTVSELADRYEIEHVSQLKPTTRAGYGTSLRRLRMAFGTRHVTAVTPQLARSYFDHCRQKHSIASARHDIAVLRGLLTFALELGVIAAHPLRGMRFPTVPPATTDVTDADIAALLALPAKTRTVQVAQLYTRVKLMTGLRRGDLLRVRVSDLDDEAGIAVTPAKTAGTSGVALVFSWTEELRETIDAVLAIPPKRRDPDTFLFTTKAGAGFYDEGERQGARLRHSVVEIHRPRARRGSNRAAHPGTRPSRRRRR